VPEQVFPFIEYELSQMTREDGAEAKVSDAPIVFGGVRKRYIFGWTVDDPRPLRQVVERSSGLLVRVDRNLEILTDEIDISPFVHGGIAWVDSRECRNRLAGAPAMLGGGVGGDGGRVNATAKRDDIPTSHRTRHCSSHQLVETLVQLTV
jgi:hypothetical protein